MSVTAATVKGAAIGFERTEADLDRYFGPVLAERVEIAARAHRPASGIGGETLAVLRVLTTEARRNQAIDRFPHNLGRRVTKEWSGESIGVSDRAARIDDEHGGWSCVDGETKSLFRLLPRC